MNTAFSDLISKITTVRLFVDVGKNPKPLSEVTFTHTGRKFVLLHGFTKKTDKNTSEGDRNG